MKILHPNNGTWRCRTHTGGDNAVWAAGGTHKCDGARKQHTEERQRHANSIAEVMTASRRAPYV